MFHINKFKEFYFEEQIIVGGIAWRNAGGWRDSGRLYIRL
jgi:hypothetical protein